MVPAIGVVVHASREPNRRTDRLVDRACCDRSLEKAGAGWGGVGGGRERSSAERCREGTDTPRAQMDAKRSSAQLSSAPAIRRPGGCQLPGMSRPADKNLRQARPYVGLAKNLPAQANPPSTDHTFCLQHRTPYVTSHFQYIYHQRDNLTTLTTTPCCPWLKMCFGDVIVI